MLFRLQTDTLACHWDITVTIQQPEVMSSGSETQTICPSHDAAVFPYNSRKKRFRWHGTARTPYKHKTVRVRRSRTSKVSYQIQTAADLSESGKLQATSSVCLQLTPERRQWRWRERCGQTVFVFVTYRLSEVSTWFGISIHSYCWGSHLGSSLTLSASTSVIYVHFTVHFLTRMHRFAIQKFSVLRGDPVPYTSQRTHTCIPGVVTYWALPRNYPACGTDCVV